MGGLCLMNIGGIPDLGGGVILALSFRRFDLDPYRDQKLYFKIFCDRCRYCSKVYRVRKSLLIHLSKRHGDHKGENSPSKSGSGNKRSPSAAKNPIRSLRGNAPEQSLLATNPTPAVKRVATSLLTPPPSKMARLSTPTVSFTPGKARLKDNHCFTL